MGGGGGGGRGGGAKCVELTLITHNPHHAVEWDYVRVKLSADMVDYSVLWLPAKAECS